MDYNQFEMSLPRKIVEMNSNEVGKKAVLIVEPGEIDQKEYSDFLKEMKEYSKGNFDGVFDFQNLIKMRFKKSLNFFKKTNGSNIVFNTNLFSDKVDEDKAVSFYHTLRGNVFDTSSNADWIMVAEYNSNFDYKANGYHDFYGFDGSSTKGNFPFHNGYHFASICPNGYLGERRNYPLGKGEHEKIITPQKKFFFFK